MKLSKKIFLLAAFIFMLLMAWLAYDISKKTTFPGSKSKNDFRKDTVDTEVNDSINLLDKDKPALR